MKRFLFILLLCIAHLARGQSITITVPGVTSPGGEKVLAFETSDTSVVKSTSGPIGDPVVATKFEVVKIKKSVGTSTNEFFKRSINGNLVSDVLFEFADASDVVYYKILIRDVLITHFSFLSPECANCSSLYHQVWFSYSKIEWTDVATGRTVKYDRERRIFY